jgi:hypothetical protein
MRTSIGTAMLAGAASGIAGAAVMAVASNLEQRFTHRPDSYIPVLDLVEKSIFALVTGALADAVIDPLPGSSARRAGLGERLKGRA